MFIGEYNHKIDTKGRLIIPSKFRELFGEKFFVTKGLDGCLVGYSVDEWKIFIENLKQSLDPLNDRHRKLLRFYSGAAMECEIDEHGRILLSTALRTHAKLEKEVILNGAVDHIEIWSREVSEEENTYDDINDIAREVAASKISTYRG